MAAGLPKAEIKPSQYHGVLVEEARLLKWAKVKHPCLIEEGSCIRELLHMHRQLGVHSFEAGNGAIQYLSIAAPVDVKDSAFGHEGEN